MPTARPQPIKHLAFERGCTQTQFAAANGLHRMKVFRVFNGVEPPTPEFVAQACAYFGATERELFRPGVVREPVYVENKISGRNPRKAVVKR